MQQRLCRDSGKLPSQYCAVVGGGINGVMTAWALADAGHRVELFERRRLMSETSRASTKLLHGGLRYLESGHFRLVREALQERSWWIAQAPHLAQPLELLLPAYSESMRPRWKLRAGLSLYDTLALGSGFPRHRWLSAAEVAIRLPSLKQEGLQGAFSFFDAQMDDHALGLWAADRCREAGVVIHEGSGVTRVTAAGEIHLGPDCIKFDRVINVAGPWASRLLEQSHVASRYRIDAVRGSHVVFDKVCPAGALLEVPGERRLFFVLPYQGRTLVGTTEVAQSVDMPAECSVEERKYLLAAYNRHFSPQMSDTDIVAEFSGMRPLAKREGEHDAAGASREYAIETSGRLVSVFGGKWTTARRLGLAVANRI